MSIHTTISDFAEMRVTAANVMSNMFKGIHYTDRQAYVSGFLNKLKREDGRFKYLNLFSDEAFNELIKDIQKFIHGRNKAIDGDINNIREDMKNIEDSIAMGKRTAGINIDSLNAQMEARKDNIIRLEYKYCPRIKLKEFPIITRMLIDEKGMFTGFKDGKFKVLFDNVYGVYAIKEFQKVQPKIKVDKKEFRGAPFEI